MIVWSEQPSSQAAGHSKSEALGGAVEMAASKEEREEAEDFLVEDAVLLALFEEVLFAAEDQCDCARAVGNWSRSIEEAEDEAYEGVER